MKVTLNIENDAELRAYIKDAIKGQVLNIVREEFIEIVKEELERKIKGTSDYAFKNMQQEAMTKATTSILMTEHKVFSWNTDFIEPYINKRLDEVLKNKDWKLLVDNLAKEKGLLIVKDYKDLSMSVWPYTQENLKAATHTFDLKDPGFLTVNIDLIQMGVGGNDSWSPVAQPLEKYQIPSGNYEYSFYIMPFAKGETTLDASLKKFKF